MTKELEFVLNIVKAAGEISKEEFVVRDKENSSYGDLVTNLDENIEKYLISEIKKQYPKFDIVSEEFNFDNKPTKNCFVIDPIDGTINFANGLPLWGIQVACVKGGKTVAAVIYMPNIDYLFYADKNGAFLNGKKLSVREVPIKNALYAIDGSQTLPAQMRMRKYSNQRRYLGACCVSYAFVAAGFMHGAVFNANKPWDYTPGLYICKMAGAVVVDRPDFHAAAMNEEFMAILEKEAYKDLS